MKRFLMGAVMVSLLIFSSCKEDENPITPTPSKEPSLKLGETFIAGTKVTLYSDDSLRVGYNALYLKVTDSVSGAVLTNIMATIQPMMMMTMSHSCPVEQPEAATDNLNLLKCFAVFQMPSNSMEPWKMNVTITNPNSGKTATGVIDITVLNSSNVKVVTGSDSMKYVFTMIPIKSPKVGTNDITFLLHKKESMLSWPAVTNASIKMTPDMPSMGHGSPNNVDPVHSSKGHYTGKVNFTMTGEWRITCDVKSGSDSLFSTYFIITL